MCTMYIIELEINLLYYLIQLSVIGDDLSVQQMDPGEWRQTRKAVRCTVHPKFSAFNYAENDIAIITVDEPFTETDTFAPTKLSRNDVGPIDGEPCQMGKMLNPFS